MGRWIHDKTYWEIIDDLGWGKTYDMEFLGKKLNYFISDFDEIDFLKKISIQKRATLDDVMVAHDNVPHYWGGADSYWDFRAHIVGLGSKVFYSCLKDINNISIAKDYKENFEYVFNYAEDFAKTVEGQDLLKIPLKEKKLMWLRESKLKRILKY